MTINYFEKVNSRTPQTTTLEALVQSIRTSESLRERTMNYRALRASDKDAADKIKRNFPGFLPAALVSEKRDRAHVTALTGLVMCDFDHVPADQLQEVRQKVNDDPHTVLSYVTVSGEGLRVLAGYVVPETDCAEASARDRYYRRIFQAINEYYARLTGHEFDPACKDLSRLSFAAYDPEAHYNPEGTKFTPDELDVHTEEARKKQKAEKKKKNKILHQIANIYKNRIKPELIRQGLLYKVGARNQHVSRTGYILNKYGFKLEDAQAWAVAQFADYPEATDVLNYCYSHTEEHGEWADQLEEIAQGGSNGKLPVATLNEILEFMRSKTEMRRNVVLGRPELRWKNSELFTSNIEPMVHTLMYQIEMERQLEAKKEKLYTLLNSEQVEEYNPLTEYLESLPQWNPITGPDYLQELADTVTLLDSEPNAHDLWRRCLKKWMVWMLVGWTHPNEVNHSILYLIGAQGTYKSTWCTSLLPPQLSDYMKIKQNSSEVRTDDLISMSSYALIVHEEADAMSQRESNTLKAMVTAKYSDERAPYARSPQRRVNIASICATGNNEQFLSNEQGTRRSLVFRVKSIVSPIDKPFNYEGIYSQAYYLMTHGFQYFFSPEEQAELEAHNRQFELVNYEEAAIQTNLRKPGEGFGKLYWMQAAQIAETLSSRSGSRMKYDANVIGKILTKLGFPKTRKRGYTGYKIVLLDFDEVRRQQELDAQDTLPENEVKDIHEAPPTVQDMYSRLLGERDDD
jgi:hypothetical protein